MGRTYPTQVTLKPGLILLKIVKVQSKVDLTPDFSLLKMIALYGGDCQSEHILS